MLVLHMLAMGQADLLLILWVLLPVVDDLITLLWKDTVCFW